MTEAAANPVPLTKFHADATTLGEIRFNGVDVKGGDTWAIQEFDGKHYAVNTDSDTVFTIESTVEASGDLHINVGQEVTGGLARAGEERGVSFSFTGGAGDSQFSVVTNGDKHFV